MDHAEQDVGAESRRLRPNMPVPHIQRLNLQSVGMLMDRVRFRDWVSKIDELTTAHCQEASLAAIELEIDKNLRRHPDPCHPGQPVHSQA